MQKVKMIAGIDGGGTKTRVLCCDLHKIMKIIDSVK